MRISKLCNKYIGKYLGKYSTIALIEILMLYQLAEAVQLSDGVVYFVNPPRLAGARTTSNTTYIWGATYYFTINLPDNAGEPLAKLNINQHQGGETIEFDLKNSKVYGKISGQKETELSLKQVIRDNKNNTMSLIFDPPISPGQTITIALEPIRNPRLDGIYLFGVTAFPPGEKVHGQFLGFGRLHFYKSKDY